MANLRGSRSIPLASKEAKKLLSQSGLSLIHHTATKTSDDSEHSPSFQPELISVKVSDDSNQSRPQPQRERGELYCQSCHVTLGDREEQLVHYRLDWHRYNLKRRLNGQASLTQEEFEKIAGGDLSSISGSESDSDSSKDEEATSSLANIEQDHFNDEDTSGTYSTSVAGSPLLYFSSQNGRHYAVYRSLVTSLKPAAMRGSLSSDLLGSLVSLTQPQVWIMLMRAGGHFAGAVFRGSTMVAHKTFHRYTVRAKRGTAQSVRDAHQGGHAPKSAGASLRRYNESALVGEIRELISSWSSHVDEASTIFIRTPKYGKGVFIGDGTGSGAPFLRTDPRLRNIPFATRRPTVKEVQNVFSKLAAVYEVNSDQLLQGPTRSPKAKPKKPVVNVKKDQETVVDLEDRFMSIKEVGARLDELELEEGADSSDEMERRNEETSGASEKTVKRKRRRRAKKTTEPQADIPASVQALLKLCKSESKDECDTEMTQLLQEMGISPITNAKTEDSLTVQSSEGITAAAVSQREEEEVPANLRNPLNEVWNGETVLHVAAACGTASLIPILLLHGADPTIKNGAGHVAYVVAKDKTVRDAFRRFMAQYPTSYDYSTAKVPSPLTEEMERERKEKMAEKKKALKKAKKQREKEHKAEKEMEQSKLNREKAVAGLSEREKRALAAEKRMSAQLPNSSTVLRAGVCSFCDSTLAGLVPFERLQYKYCSMDCLKNHRKQLT